MENNKEINGREKIDTTSNLKILETVKKYFLQKIMLPIEIFDLLDFNKILLTYESFLNLEYLSERADFLINYLLVHETIPTDYSHVSSKLLSKEQLLEKKLNAFYRNNVVYDRTERTLSTKQRKKIFQLWEKFSTRSTGWNALSINQKLIVLEYFLCDKSKIPNEKDKTLKKYILMIDGKKIIVEVSESSLVNFYRRNVSNTKKNTPTAQKKSLNAEIKKVRSDWEKLRQHG